MHSRTRRARFRTPLQKTSRFAYSQWWRSDKRTAGAAPVFKKGYIAAPGVEDVWCGRRIWPQSFEMTKLWAPEGEFWNRGIAEGNLSYYHHEVIWLLGDPLESPCSAQSKKPFRALSQTISQTTSLWRRCLETSREKVLDPSGCQMGARKVLSPVRLTDRLRALSIATYKDACKTGGPMTLFGALLKSFVPVLSVYKCNLDISSETFYAPSDRWWTSTFEWPVRRPLWKCLWVRQEFLHTRAPR